MHESTSTDRFYNTQLVISHQGSIVEAYRKVAGGTDRRGVRADELAMPQLHLFDVDIAGGATILESNTTVPGERLLDPVHTPIGSSQSISRVNFVQSSIRRAVGLLTCYDLRFAEVSLSLRRRGAQILTYPSAFTLRTGAAHWGE